MAMTTQAFQWTGLNNQGNRVNGLIEAANSKDAQVILKKMEIEVITLEVKQKINFKLAFLSVRKKIHKRNILLFTRYLSTMLTAGLPLIQALDVMSNDKENPGMKSLIDSIKANISEGKTLAESLSKYPDHFNDLYCNLIKAGEKSGALNNILIRIGNYLERTENLKRKIKKALIYPAAIITIALIVSLILLLFVVPQFEGLFKSFGAQLPLFTRMVVSLSTFIRQYWWVAGISIVFIIWCIRYLIKKSERLQLLIDKLVLRIYIIGPIFKKGIIARFTRTLATSLESGMPIVESMESMPAIMGNKVYSNAIIQICNDVIKGHQLSASMEASQLFPNMAVQMIAVGEVSGKLSDMLNKVADHYEEEVNTIVDNLSSLLEPVIMLLLGVIVGGFVVAMYLPIFRLGALF